MRSKLLCFALAAICSLFLTQSIFAGTLGDTITVTAADGVPVDHFEVRVKEAIGFTIVPVSDPADDPDSDGDIVVPVDGTGLVGTIGIAEFLTGQPTGAYVIEAASVDANGQMSGWATKNFTYSAPGNPTITVGDATAVNPLLYRLNDTQTQYALLDRRIRRLT